MYKIYDLFVAECLIRNKTMLTAFWWGNSVQFINKRGFLVCITVWKGSSVFIKWGANDAKNDIPQYFS